MLVGAEPSVSRVDAPAGVGGRDCGEHIPRVGVSDFSSRDQWRSGQRSFDSRLGELDGSRVGAQDRSRGHGVAEADGFGDHSLTLGERLTRSGS